MIKEFIDTVEDVAQKAMDVAERDAIINEQYQEIELYKKKVEKLETAKDEEDEKKVGDKNEGE